MNLKNPSAKSLPQMNLKEKLQQSKNELQKWSQVARDPDLSPRATSVAHQMVRSMRAAAQIRQKALDAFPVEQPEDQKIPEGPEYPIFPLSRENDEPQPLPPM